MKKTFKLSALFASLGLLLGLTSCKKDWKCNCSYTYDGSTYNDDVAVYPSTKKADAKKLCDAYETLLQSYYSDASCSLK